MCGWCMPKLPKISLLFRKFCTFPATEGYAIWHSISSSQPRQESSPTEWNSSMSGCRKTQIWKHHNSSLLQAREMPKLLPRKDTNFGNTMILPHFRPEKCQKSYPERHKFRKHHNSLLLQARETPKILPRKTRISETPWIFCTLGQRTPKTRPRKTRISGMP